MARRWIPSSVARVDGSRRRCQCVKKWPERALMFWVVRILDLKEILARLGVSKLGAQLVLVTQRRERREAERQGIRILGRATAMALARCEHGIRGHWGAQSARPSSPGPGAALLLSSRLDVILTFVSMGAPLLASRGAIPPAGAGPQG
jgi:hypothetical protein